MIASVAKEKMQTPCLVSFAIAALNLRLRNLYTQEIYCRSRFSGLTWVWLVTAVQRGAVGPSESRRLQERRKKVFKKVLKNISLSLSRAVKGNCRCYKYSFIFSAHQQTHNFAKTPLKLNIRLTWVVDVGLTVFASQAKFVVHWKMRNQN